MQTLSLRDGDDRDGLRRRLLRDAGAAFDQSTLGETRLPARATAGDVRARFVGAAAEIADGADFVVRFASGKCAVQPRRRTTPTSAPAPAPAPGPPLRSPRAPPEANPAAPPEAKPAEEPAEARATPGACDLEDGEIVCDDAPPVPAQSKRVIKISRKRRRPQYDGRPDAAADDAPSLSRSDVRAAVQTIVRSYEAVVHDLVCECHKLRTLLESCAAPATDADDADMDFEDELDAAVMES